MKLYDFSVVVFLVIIVTCVVGGTLTGIFWKPDNPVKEVSEEIIKHETGVDLDLSPFSPEYPIA